MRMCKSKLAVCPECDGTGAGEHFIDIGDYYPCHVCEGHGKIDYVGIVCPYCDEIPELKTSEEFYGIDYGTNLYVCTPCDAYVSTFGRSRRPKGSLAKLQLRQLRVEAHKQFDVLWKYRGMTRTQAYKWMAKFMGKSKEEAHIGLFTEEECQKLITYMKGMHGV